jgi:uncharacterized membrane protein YccF (DUF307 family)
VLGLLTGLLAGGIDIVHEKVLSAKRAVVRGLVAFKLAQFAMWLVLAGILLMLSAMLVAIAQPLGYPVAALLTGLAAIALAAGLLGLAKAITTKDRPRRPG